MICWVCEVLSPGEHAIARVDKLTSCFGCGIEHLWLANPDAKLVETYRRGESGPLVLNARCGQTLRAAPFEAIELQVDAFFEP